MVRYRNTRLGEISAVESRFTKCDEVIDIDWIVVWKLEGNISQHYHSVISGKEEKEII